MRCYKTFEVKYFTAIFFLGCSCVAVLRSVLILGGISRVLLIVRRDYAKKKNGGKKLQVMMRLILR